MRSEWSAVSTNIQYPLRFYFVIVLLHLKKKKLITKYLTLAKWNCINIALIHRSDKKRAFQLFHFCSFFVFTLYFIFVGMVDHIRARRIWSVYGWVQNAHFDWCVHCVSSFLAVWFLYLFSFRLRRVLWALEKRQTQLKKMYFVTTSMDVFLSHVYLSLFFLIFRESAKKGSALIRRRRRFCHVIIKRIRLHKIIYTHWIWCFCFALFCYEN